MCLIGLSHLNKIKFYNPDIRGLSLSVWLAKTKNVVSPTLS